MDRSLNTGLLPVEHFHACLVETGYGHVAKFGTDSYCTAFVDARNGQWAPSSSMIEISHLRLSDCQLGYFLNPYPSDRICSTTSMFVQIDLLMAPVLGKLASNV